MRPWCWNLMTYLYGDSTNCWSGPPGNGSLRNFLTINRRRPDIHTHRHIYIYTYMYMYIYIYTYSNTYIYIYIHTHRHTRFYLNIWWIMWCKCVLFCLASLLISFFCHALHLLVHGSLWQSPGWGFVKFFNPQPGGNSAAWTGHHPWLLSGYFKPGKWLNGTFVVSFKVGKIIYN